MIIAAQHPYTRIQLTSANLTSTAVFLITSVVGIQQWMGNNLDVTNDRNCNSITCSTDVTECEDFSAIYWYYTNML